MRGGDGSARFRRRRCSLRTGSRCPSLSMWPGHTCRTSRRLPPASRASCRSRSSRSRTTRFGAPFGTSRWAFRAPGDSRRSSPEQTPIGGSISTSILSVAVGESVCYLAQPVDIFNLSRSHSVQPVTLFDAATGDDHGYFLLRHGLSPVPGKKRLAPCAAARGSTVALLSQAPPKLSNAALAPCSAPRRWCAESSSRAPGRAGAWRRTRSRTR